MFLLELVDISRSMLIYHDIVYFRIQVLQYFRWMPCLVYHVKSQQEVAIVMPYMEICFFGNQAEVDEHVASCKNQKIDNVSVIILTKGYTSQINLFPRYAIISLLVIP